MFYDNPLWYIGGLLGLFLEGMVLLSFGLDVGQVIVVVCIELVLGIIGIKRYQHTFQRMGKKGFMNLLVHRVDSTLPAPFPEVTDELTQASVPYHDFYHQEPTAEERELFGGPIPQREYASVVTEELHEVGAPNVQAMLPPASTPYVPLSPATGQLMPPYPQLPPNMYHLHLGDRAYVDAQQAFTNSFLLENLQPGTENFTRVMFEEVAQQGTPLLLIDVVDAFSSLFPELPIGWLIGSPEVPPPDEQLRAHYIPLTKTDAQRAGQMLLQEGGQAIFRFDTYPTREQAAEIVLEILTGMEAWQLKRRHKTGRPLRCVVGITEAYRVLPDDLTQSHLQHLGAAKQFSTAILARLKNKGTLGMYFYIMSRKISGVDPEVLRLLDLWMMKHPSHADIESGWPTYLTGLLPEAIKQVPYGHVLITDTVSRNPQVVLFRDSRSEHGGQDRLHTAFSVPTFGAQEVVTPPFPYR